MAKPKLIIAVGALAILGAAVALAQTGSETEQTGGGHGMHGRGFDSDQGRQHHRGWGRGEGRRGGRDMTLEDMEARARERFARFDKNGDNVLDVGEIEARFTSENAERRGRRGGDRQGAGRGGMGGQDGRMGGGMMMRRMDTDNDGKITRGEVETRLKSRFARLDLNNDGRITDADLPPMLRGRSFLAGGDTMHAGMGMRGHGQGGQGRMRGARGMMGLRGTDTNKDGAVTFEEFAARHFARFEARDRNKDAVIDTADFDAMRKEMLDYRVARFIHRFGPEADKARSVTREQFLALAKQRFERMDRNDDGRVDRQDRGGGRGEGRGRNRDNR